MSVALDQRMQDLTCFHRQHLGVPDLRGGSGSFRLFTEGDDLHDAMISAIEAAQRSVRLEVFIFAADEVGWRFARALSAKARTGVDVRFHFDSRGAATRYSSELFREMVDAGVKLKWYRPWSWRHPSHYFQRNHRKLLVIDERELFLGGFNIRVENSRALYTHCMERERSGIPTSRSGVSLPDTQRSISTSYGIIQIARLTMLRP